MKKLLTGAVVASALAIAPTAATAHTCKSKGTKHAVIKSKHKCLKTGQFCRRADDRKYRNYGFKCVTGSDDRARLRKR